MKMNRSNNTKRRKRDMKGDYTPYCTCTSPRVSEKRDSATCSLLHETAQEPPVLEAPQLDLEGVFTKAVVDPCSQLVLRAAEGEPTPLSLREGVQLLTQGHGLIARTIQGDARSQALFHEVNFLVGGLVFHLKGVRPETDRLLHELTQHAFLVENHISHYIPPLS